MAKFIQSIMKTFVLSLVFFGTGVMIVHVTKGWTGTDGLTAQTGDTLTAEKWNTLNAKVDSISASNGGWEEVSLTNTAIFNTGCDRKVEGEGINMRNQAIVTNSILYLEMYGSNWFYINSTSKSLIRLQNNATTRPNTRMWKKCFTF